MFPQRLKKLRLENNLTQVMLGKISGVSSAQIAKYENGLSKPRPKTLSKLSKVLGVDPAYFTDDIVVHHNCCLERSIRRLKQVINNDTDKKTLITLIDAFYYRIVAESRK